MAGAVSGRGALSPSGTGEADLEDSNVSSPLSEVEDGDANDDDMQHIRIDGRNEDADNSSPGVNEPPNESNKDDRSDSDSALSEAAFDETSEANDTEAETERLYDSPTAKRQRDVLVDQYNQSEVFEHTPSKLGSTSRLVSDAEKHPDHDSLSDDEASIASRGKSPSKLAASSATSINDGSKRDSQERKRKRSPMGDQSESEQPLRKRLTSDGAAEPTTDVAHLHDDTILSEQQGGRQALAMLTNSNAATDGEVLGGTEIETAKTADRAGSKKKSGSSNTSPADTPQQDIGGEPLDIADDDDVERRNEDIEVDADEHDAAAKSIEEAERKSAALRDWTHIEEMFGIFRDRLYKDRLRRLEEEEQSLLGDAPTHPEFLNMKQCLDDRLERTLHEVNTEFDFRLAAHERRAVAVRAQVWSQFFQAVREKREAALESLNRQWYEVQTARRSAHSLPDYGLLFPKDRAQRLRNAIAYNTEVSTLAGLAKFEGFPAGPELDGASIFEMEADFGTIEQVRRSRHKTTVSVREEFPNPAFSRLGPAGEQFIKDTPWANPHHSSHKLLQQAPSAATTARLNQPAVSTAALALLDVKPSKVENQPPVRKSPASKSRVSESPELSRTMLNPSAHQMRRVSSIPNLERGSKAAAA